jgi:F420-dependent oxidoreductase-like protein
MYHMPSFTYEGVGPEGIFEHAVGQALAAEAAGFDQVTVMDHFYQIQGVGPETEPMLEAWTTLGALAARTSRVRLGTLVTGVTYRNPAMLAKIATTLDVISGGRAVLGIGAAWNEDEHLGYGFGFPPIRERMDRLEEALQIIKAMFTEARPSFEGRYHRIDRALNRPRPLQPGGPPVLVGGMGERRTLRLVARYADISNFISRPIEVLKHLLQVLERHCEAEGRDPATILKTTMTPFTLVSDEREAKRLADLLPPDAPPRDRPATPDQALAILGDLKEAGFGGFTWRNPNLPTQELIELAGTLKQQLG